MNLATILRRLCLLALLCLLCCAGALAAEAGELRIAMDRQDATVRWQLDSGIVHENALVVTAVYENGQMLEAFPQTLELTVGTFEGSHRFGADFDSFRVYVLDGSTCVPLCPCGEPRQVLFTDHDGTVLSEQLVLPGQGAVPPAVPERSGYVFTGWDGDYETVYDDAVFTAQYAAADSANIFTVSSAHGTVGDTVTVTVSLTGTVQLCAYDLRLMYDPEALEFVGVDAELSMDVTANKSADGRILFNYSSTKNRARGGDIIAVTFRILDSGRAASRLTLSHKSVDLIDPDDKTVIRPAPYILCEGVVTIA